MDQFKPQLDQLIAACTSVQERRIGYGNLRCESSDWHRAEEEITNIALIYETPGGSTCQINIDYNHDSGEFSFLGAELERTVVTSEPRDVMAMIDQHIRGIPEKRLSFLHQQIDEWVGEGKTRSQLFAELNKLLQAEFLGGRITPPELRQGIHYAINRYAAVT